MKGTRREHQRGRHDARHGRRERRDALGRRDRRLARPHRRRPHRGRCRLQPDRASRRVRSRGVPADEEEETRRSGTSPGGRGSRRWKVDRPRYVLGWTVAFSPDGRMLATSGADLFVHLWDVRTGKLVGELEQNVGNAVWSLEFSPDCERARHLRRRPLRVPLGRGDRRPDRPEARRPGAARRRSTCPPTDAAC